MSTLTREERNAIATLRRLARRWPKSLMLMAGTGGLAVIRTADYTSGRLQGSGGSFTIETIAILSDGGDPW